MPQAAPPAYIGAMPNDEPNMGPQQGEPLDLAERLARYRARVKREGRQSAVEHLDRAIDEALKKRSRS